jgi:type I restriction-modification system DNA methylase subunit
MAEVPTEIKDLVEKFERNLDAYKNSSYKEEQLKQEFINPFFKALGWDVDNVSGAAPQYRDVIFEDSIKVTGGKAPKAPDYCFTLAGRKMFFVEAKKPSVDINTNKEAAYQLRRYAWSAKLPLSILTDFKELAVYESRIRPKPHDNANVERIKIINYKDYADKWDYIYSRFSKNAVLQGSFDKFAESTKNKRGTTQVDDAFLSEIEGWRELFAKNIALRNPEISIEELNYSVQQIIDRIVFLRMCEDRGVEKYEQLRDLLNNDDIYHHFGEICLNADLKYNSGLFHFKEEKGRGTSPDTLTLDLKIDDRVFKTIIKDLYYPNSPYEFSVLSPEILGNVYEQFLGKVIRLTDGHHAKIEEKPEVKKAGGVYYTPQFIVDYIVENTVGELCKGKTPNKVSQLRILDPACGSGSFLIGAYNFLLKWHLDYYNNLKDKKRLKDIIYEVKKDEWHLTVKEKKHILLNNIYGVDIDHQAVEVTKLSLLLKVLEGENKDVLEAQQKLFKERALPDLDNNIKCGNSLIGQKIYKDEYDFDNEDIQRINPFDWEADFSKIMNNNKFDVVIGNPPYIRNTSLNTVDKEFFKKNYSSSYKQYDIFVLFFELGMTLLNETGYLGFITSNKFLASDYGYKLREIILKKSKIISLIDVSFLNVFKEASTYPVISIFKKESKEVERTNNKVICQKINQFNELNLTKNNKNLKKLKQKEFLNDERNRFLCELGGIKFKIIRKMDREGIKLKDLFKISRGSPKNKIKILDKNTSNSLVCIISKAVFRYIYLESPDYFVISDLQNEILTEEKILLPRTVLNLRAAYDSGGEFIMDRIYYLISKTPDIDLKYVTLLLNSKLMDYYYKVNFGTTHVGGGYLDLRGTQIKEFPLKFSSNIETLSKKAELMIQLHQKLKSAKIPIEKERIQRQMDAMDEQIDNMVYELYGLTKEEIKIVKDSIS